MSLFAQENWIDITNGHSLGDSDVYETHCDTLGELYRASQSVYGRCTGRVYVSDGFCRQSVGWIFLKRERYQDCDETYLKETWVTVHESPPTKTFEYHYVYGQAA